MYDHNEDQLKFKQNPVRIWELIFLRYSRRLFNGGSQLQTSKYYWSGRVIVELRFQSSPLSKYTKLMTSKLANALPKIATSLNPQSYSSASSVQLISKKSSLTLTHPIPRFKYYALHTSYIFSVRDENFIKLLVQKTLCSSKKRSPPEKHKNQTHKLNKSKSFAFVYKNFSWFSIFSKKSFEFILRDVCR